MLTGSQLSASFMESADTLWVCQASRLVFRSEKKGIAPLLEYIEQFTAAWGGTTIYDRVIGNAAALLLKKVSCKKVYGIIGSELAIETLKRLRIPYSFRTVVPNIINRTGNDMCPFEKASLGKETEEFYQLAKELIAK